MSATQTAESTKRRVTKAAPKKAAKQAAPVKAAAKKAAPKVQAAPAKKSAKPAPKQVETITLKTVFEHLAETHDLTRKQGQSLLSDFVLYVTQTLKNGDKLRLSGLGVLEVKDRPARMGRNPRTGVVVEIPAGRKVSFRAAKELKEAV